VATGITWYGHNCWLLESAGQRLLIDPFLNDSPVAPLKAADVAAEFVLVSHGHFDHIADAASIAKRTSAVVLTNFECGNWLAGQGVAADKIIGMNPGGAVTQPFGRLKMTPAIHSSSLPDGTYGGAPCGLLLELAGQRLYFACDTALFSDMQLIGAAGLDLAVLPIGDRFTMGPDDSLLATKLLSPQRVAPCHYNTWPPINQDAAAWAERIRLETSAIPFVPQIGEAFEI